MKALKSEGEHHWDMYLNEGTRNFFSEQDRKD